MEVVNISKRKYASLQPLVLPKNVSNTEAQMYILPAKNKWRRSEFVLKRLYQDTGEVFGNKLYTVSTLLDLKSQIAIDELVMPSSIAALNRPHFTGVFNRTKSWIFKRSWANPRKNETSKSTYRDYQFLFK